MAGELSADGTSLLFSTYLDVGQYPPPTMALDPSAAWYVGGSACTASLFVPAAAQTANPGGADGYLVKLDLSPAPSISINNVVNDFDIAQGSGAIAPGEIVSVLGNGIGPMDAQDRGLNATQALGTTFAGVQVFFDGVAAPLVTVQAQKVVAVVPSSVAGKNTVQVQAQYQGQSSNPLTVRVQDAAPTLLTLDGSGTGQAYAQNQDGTLNGPDNPAARGSAVTLFATGLGLTQPPSVDGSIIAQTQPRPVQKIGVLLSDSTLVAALTPATAVDAAAVPTFITGLFYIRFTVPSGAQAGASVSVFAYVGQGQSQTQSGVTLAVK